MLTVRRDSEARREDERYSAFCSSEAKRIESMLSGEFCGGEKIRIRPSYTAPNRGEFALIDNSKKPHGDIYVDVRFLFPRPTFVDLKLTVTQRGLSLADKVVAFATKYEGETDSANVEVYIKD